MFGLAILKGILIEVIPKLAGSIYGWVKGKIKKAKHKLKK
jgi:hypothetical protein